MRNNILNTVKKKTWTPGKRNDPYLANNFKVEFDGIPVASFTDISGLGVETQYERKTFGGENDKEYIFISQTKFSEISLKNGVTDKEYLWDWFMAVVNGKIKRLNGAIYLYDAANDKAVVWWDITDACPVKWEGPVFSSTGNAVAFETLVFTHQGIHRNK